MRELQAAGGAALSDEVSPGAGPPDVGSGDAPAVSGRATTRRTAVALLVVIAAVVLLADLVTKELTVAHLSGRPAVRLLGGAVHLTYVTNSGAAFGIGGSYTFVFPIIAVVVIGWIGWMAWRLRSRLWATSLGLLLGGVTGNLVDRLFRPPGPLRGRVVDMISVFAPDGSVFPVFNLADSALVVGVSLAVWLELTGRRRDGSRVVPARRRSA